MSAPLPVTRDAPGRLLLFWNRPQHLREHEAEAWLRAELARVLGRDGLHRARLTRLSSASPCWPPPWDWMLEVDLPARAGGGRPAPAVRGECLAWLGDLSLLGMRPAAMLAADGNRMTGGEDRLCDAVETGPWGDLAEVRTCDAAS